MPLLANHFGHFLLQPICSEATNFSSFATEDAWEFQVEVLTKYGASKSRVLWLVLSLQVVKCFRKLGNCQVCIHQNTVNNVSTIFFERTFSLLLVSHHGPQKKKLVPLTQGRNPYVYIYIYTVYIYILYMYMYTYTYTYTYMYMYMYVYIYIYPMYIP